MSKPETAIIDCDDMSQKRAFMQVVGSWRGTIKVTWKACRPIRSWTANKYYFAGVVEPFREYLIETGESPYIDNEYAHETLKLAILQTREQVLPGGKVLRLPPTTKDMDTVQFNEYTELAIAFLAEFCNIAVVPSDLFKAARERGQTISTQIM